MSNSPKILSYRQIKQTTEEFLREKHLGLNLPIPIEDIIELNLKIKLTSLKGLKANFDIDAFINSACNEIFIDNTVFLKYEERSRFSLAHELGHKILHEEIYSQEQFYAPEEFIAFQENMPEKDYGWLEYQANVFAGCLLVPTEKLKTEVLKAIKERENQSGRRIYYSLS
ncbi:MAG: hypothetical protein UR81_C0008G0016 [Candidatus Levybacteria bacterium GW2011_GWB1_35_5]|nr:MAG: hypothetical protein UR81_C0008G0016 [Candidatus Levybacteria bacterium GW2011_GWB1_35_5]